MREYEGTHAPAVQHFANDDKEAWKAYWKKQGQPWRTEPEIDQERQEFLDKCRTTTPDIEQGIYPFRGIELSRADIEWLLATHENGRGPVDWSDESQHERKGLDLRGADLSMLNLSFLPLARLWAGLTHNERWLVNREQRYKAAAHLKGTNLFQAHLEAAILGRARLEDANLELAHLELADLGGRIWKGQASEEHI